MSIKEYQNNSNISKISQISLKISQIHQRYLTISKQFKHLKNTSNIFKKISNTSKISHKSKTHPAFSIKDDFKKIIQHFCRCIFTEVYFPRNWMNLRNCVVYVWKIERVNCMCDACKKICSCRFSICINCIWEHFLMMCRRVFGIQAPVKWGGPTNQPTHQPTKQPNNQPTSQSTNQPTN